jgi:chromosome segregation ATPase
MAKHDREAGGGATFGEAVGLASQDQLAAERRRREEAERKLANIQEQWEKADAGATETAGTLADVTDVLFGDGERAATKGYEGVLDRATSLVLDLGRAREEVVKALADAGTAWSAAKYAERETVAAKGEQVRLGREVARLGEANGALTSEVDRLRAKGNETWAALQRARADLDQVRADRRRLEAELDAALCAQAPKPDGDGAVTVDGSQQRA